MYSPYDPFSGRSIQRHIRRHRFIDPATGEEFTSEQVVETSEAFDGVRDPLDDLHNAVPNRSHALQPCHSAQPGHSGRYALRALHFAKWPFGECNPLEDLGGARCGISPTRDD